MEKSTGKSFWKNGVENYLQIAEENTSKVVPNE